MKNFSPLAVIILLVVTFLMFWDAQPEYFINKSEKSPLTDQVLEADSYMSNIELTKFSSSGNPELLITASSSRYFEKDNYAEMDNPHLTSFDEEKPAQPWELTASHGIAYEQSDKLVFTKQVRMWQYTGVDTINELLSEQLTVYPDKKLASSNTKVTISTPKGITTGVKMNANLANKTFKLHKDVKGVHFAL